MKGTENEEEEVGTEKEKKREVWVHI